MPPLTPDVALLLLTLGGGAGFMLYVGQTGQQRRIFWLWSVLVGMVTGCAAAFLALGLPALWLQGRATAAVAWTGLALSPLAALLGTLWVWFVPAYDAQPLSGWDRLGRAGWPILKTVLLLPWTILTVIATPRGISPRRWWGGVDSTSPLDDWDPTLSSRPSAPGELTGHAGPDPPQSVCPFCGEHNYARLKTCAACGKPLPPRPELDEAAAE